MSPTAARGPRPRRPAAAFGPRAIISAAIAVGLATFGSARSQPAPPRAVTITIDPSRAYQTFQAWGASASFLRNLSFVSQATLDQITEEAVNDLGLTFLRLGFGYLAEPFNDNGNPREIDWSRFIDTRTIEREGALGLSRFARLVQANGETPVFLLNKDWEHSAPGWMSDAEFAENVAATILYYRDKLGIDIAFTSIDNEPGYHDPYTPDRHRSLIRAMGPAFEAFGLKTRIALNEGINPASTWNYVRALQGDRTVWRYIGLLNWHLYGNVHDPYRSQIRDFGLARGIPTGQTEYNAKIKELIPDLTLGGVSYWTRYHLADHGGDRNAPSTGNFFVAHLDGTSFSRNNEYWRVRQFTRYVRPGAVRIEAASSVPAVRAFAFARRDSRTTIVVNDTPVPAAVTVRGLLPGRHGVSQTSGTVYRELGARTIDAAGTLDLAVPAQSIVTMYPHPGANQRPIVTAWRAAPGFLTLPASEITISAAAQDVEHDALTFSWSVARRPDGATVALASPAAAQTRATGLTAPGEYVFTVAVRDTAGATTSRDVTVRAYAGNQRPVIVDGHRLFRDGWLVGERTSVYGPLFISAFDLEGDPVSTSFSVVSQPPGANARFEGTRVSGLNVAGTYVFRFTARDPGGEVSRDFEQVVKRR